MGLLKEGLFAFRGRRLVEWLFMDRPQVPICFGIGFYTLLYMNYKYDLIARWKGQPTYNDYSYVTQAVERERTRQAALTSSPTPIPPSSQLSPSSSSIGVN